jgi:hypothetical protein
MGELRYRMQDPQGAAELYRAALRQDACLVSASLGLSTVLRAQDQVEEAKQVLRRAAACPSSSSDAAYHVGLALEQQGLGRDALQVWEDVFEQALVPRSTSAPFSTRFGSESPNFVPNSRRRTEGSMWRRWPHAHNPPFPKTPTKRPLTLSSRFWPRDSSPKKL